LGSLPVAIVKKHFLALGLGFSVGNATNGGILAFLAEFTWPRRQPNGPFFWLKFFWKLGYNPRL